MTIQEELNKAIDVREGKSGEVKRMAKSTAALLFLTALLATVLCLYNHLHFSSELLPTQLQSTSSIINEHPDNVYHLRRLSLDYDLHTGENVRTVNGTIPEVSCPLGYVCVDLTL